jgi:hypothetical protein
MQSTCKCVCCSTMWQLLARGLVHCRQLQQLPGSAEGVVAVLLCIFIMNVSCIASCMVAAGCWLLAESCFSALALLSGHLLQLLPLHGCE